RLGSARRIFCVGLRSSFPIAYMFHYVSSLFGGETALVDGPGGIGVDALRVAASCDVLLAVSVNPYTCQTVQIAQHCVERGVPVVALTDSVVAPIGRIASDVVIIPTETASFFHTMVPALAAIECLAALVAARASEKTLKMLSASEAQLAAFDTYIVSRQKKSGRSRRPARSGS
ncbi:MAG: MurR/RpiR family transcriptional regulator, partial [Hyphomicrobiaceae bacterium]